MKETKVYVDELPKSCSKCLFCYDNRPYWKSTDCIINHKELDEDEIETSVNENCPLHSIKDYKKEPVKEVCGKIRTMTHKVGKLVFCEHCYKTNSARAIDEHLLNEILGQIESEFEQKEFEK